MVLLSNRSALKADHETSSAELVYEQPLPLSGDCFSESPNTPRYDVDYDRLLAMILRRNNLPLVQ